jgi:carboxymethylenebutenolidase
MSDLSGRGRDRAVRDAGRRGFLRGLASLPLAAASFGPLAARAQPSSLKPVEFETAEGAPVRGALALPDTATAPSVILIHEWWGLNDQVRGVASQLAELGFVAFAVDLFDAEPTEDPDEATRRIEALDADAATAKLVAAIGWLAALERVNGKVGTIGWGFGGGWSLDASIATPVDATVVYYGDVEKTESQLSALHGPVLCHFATRDEFVTREMVERFEGAMEEAEKSQFLTVYWYDADYAFANPDSARYDASNARLAWDRTVEFLRAALA